MSESLSKKVCQAYEMAGISGKAQALCLNATEGYDISPLDRCTGASTLMSVYGPMGDRITPEQRDQFLGLCKCPGANITKEDVVEAAYALGFYAATGTMPPAIPTELPGMWHESDLIGGEADMADQMQDAQV